MSYAEIIMATLKGIAGDNVSKYKYKLISQKESSAKYGLCEVCGKFVSEVFHQIESRKYEDGYTYAGCKDYFGHKECLESKQR